MLQRADLDETSIGAMDNSSRLWGLWDGGTRSPGGYRFGSEKQKQTERQIENECILQLSSRGFYTLNQT